MDPSKFKRTGAADFPRHLKCLVAGPPKSGKTSLLGTMPKILVLDTEPFANNLQSLAHLNVMSYEITNTEDLRDIAMVLGNDTLRKQLAQSMGEDDILSVAIDTADSLQKIMKKERMAEQRSSQFLRDDWGWIKDEMASIVRMFMSLPLHVVFTVHLKTQEVGKGDSAWTQVMPGLEGGIAGDIAGMVGYSLLSFRQEEIAPDGTPFMRYLLRTEADSTHDFLGTRVNGVKLPTVIEPDFKTIYQAVMANVPAPAPAVQVPQEVAQPASQPEQVQTPVETPQPAQQAPADVAPTAEPPAERPTDDQPINPAAMTFVKRVYDALQVGFPTETVEKLTMGQARELVQVWKAIQQDHMEGKNAEGTTPTGEMADYLRSMGWYPDEAQAAPEAKPEAEVVPSATGTMPQIKAYIGNPPNLERVQEVYELEQERDTPRVTLIERLEAMGAKPASPSPEPQQDVQTPVETPAEPVTPEAQPADTSGTDEATSETSGEQTPVELLQDKLGAEVISTEVPKDAKCNDCGKPVDDTDLAEVGRRRFGVLLCTNDYVARTERTN